MIASSESAILKTILKTDLRLGRSLVTFSVAVTVAPVVIPLSYRWQENRQEKMSIFCCCLQSLHALRQNNFESVLSVGRYGSDKREGRTCYWRQPWHWSCY